mmetsp:Transcript_16410/g.35531  ORF Transcript_16410/g.35531 Transcript_16410/m.35531 type:complete len:140 (+) Transcript_16410:1132-1551(+)
MRSFSWRSFGWLSCADTTTVDEESGAGTELSSGVDAAIGGEVASSGMVAMNLAEERRTMEDVGDTSLLHNICDDGVLMCLVGRVSGIINAAAKHNAEVSKFEHDARMAIAAATDERVNPRRYIILCIDTPVSVDVDTIA